MDAFRCRTNIIGEVAAGVEKFSRYTRPLARVTQCRPGPPSSEGRRRSRPSHGVLQPLQQLHLSSEVPAVMAVGLVAHVAPFLQFSERGIQVALEWDDAVIVKFDLPNGS
jgi:hypothetical protein